MNKRVFLMLCLLLMQGTASAASLKPNSGLWWEEPVTGRFYSVEIAPSGKTFVVISEFDEQGKPVWRSMRGELELSSEQEQRAGAPLARLTAALTDIDGACPSCLPSAPNVRPSTLGTATIVFTSGAEAEYQQGAIRRPLRYFTPADQPQDFPSARLAGAYALAIGKGTAASARPAVLEPARDPVCASYQGARPPEAAVRLRGNCPAGICDSANGGLQLSQLELAVGPGEHPEIIAYQRTLAPEAYRVPSCYYSYFGAGGLICGCPNDYTLTPAQVVGGSTCIRDDGPFICTESHRITEQAGVIRGLPLRDDQMAFTLFPTGQ